MKISALAYANERFVAFAQGSQGPLVLVSTNENVWTLVDLPIANYVSTAFSANSLLIGLADGLMLSSSDGFTWAARPSGIIGLPKKVAGTEGDYWAFAAEGNTSRLYRSTLGTNWVLASTFTDTTLNSLAVGAGAIVMRAGVYPQPRILRVSTNQAVSWFDVPCKTPLQDIAFGEGKFVAVGDYSYVATSTNGMAWNDQYLSHVFFRKVAFAAGSFIAAGLPDVPISPFAPTVSFWSSTDGDKWTPHALPFPGEVRNLTFGSNSWVAVQNNSTLLRSAPVMPYFLPDQVRLAGNLMRFAVDNARRADVTVQWSPDLRSWNDLTNTSAKLISVEESLQSNRRFFRLRP